MFKTLKSIALSVLILILGAFNLQAQKATAWKLDKKHTSVNFSINHFFSAVTGKFKDFDGTFNFDPNNLKESQFSFSINIKSVDTDDKRDNHLQSEDFFNSKLFPKITFQSSKIEKKSEKDYLVYGKLTIRDITKDIVLPVKVTGTMQHPMMKETTILGLSLTTSIDRSTYGVGTGSWASTMVVGDPVDITVHMELNN